MEGTEWVILAEWEEMEAWSHSGPGIGSAATRVVAIIISQRISTVCAAAPPAPALRWSRIPPFHLQWTLRRALAWVRVRWPAPQHQAHLLLRQGGLVGLVN